MELKDFIQKVTLDIVNAIEESRKQSGRDMHLNSTSGKRTIEFDIAVTTEDNVSAGGNAGIKVLHFIEGGGSVDTELKNSTVSRIQFGIHVETQTKDEHARLEASYANLPTEY